MKRYVITFWNYRTDALPLWEYIVEADTPAAATHHALSLRPQTLTEFRWIEVREV